MKSELKDALERWQKHCELVQTSTTLIAMETVAQKKKRIERLRSNYSEFVDYYFPHFTTDPDTGKHTSCAPFHIKAANRILKNRNHKEVAKWARGHAKSTHFDIFIPLWLKCQEIRQLKVMVLVGKSETNACTLLADIQAELENNQRYIADFGIQKSTGSWMDGEFVTADDTAFFARGRGQSPRGLRYRSNRPDYIVIDDLDDDELVQNESRVRKLTDWVKEALFGALDGGRGRFIMVGNLIGKCSVLANIEATPGVTVTQVNAIDSKGEPAWKSKWTIEELRSAEQFMGYRSFQKEMMNNPITEGAVFRNNWIKWTKLPKLRDFDHIIAYCDPSFKGSTKNDYKAIKVWGKKGTNLYQIRAFVRQCSVAEMVRWWYDFHESLPEGVVCLNYIEANFLQDIILDEFTREGNSRGYQLPLVPDRRKKPDKFQRIEAVSPLWERGFVFYDEKQQSDPDTCAGMEQLLAFEKGTRTHDDAPDADEGAIYKLQKQTRVEQCAPLIKKRTNIQNSW